MWLRDGEILLDGLGPVMVKISNGEEVVEKLQKCGQNL
jgi:hypothetical protein